MSSGTRRSGHDRLQLIDGVNRGVVPAHQMRDGGVNDLLLLKTRLSRERVGNDADLEVAGTVRCDLHLRPGQGLLDCLTQGGYDVSG